MSIQIKNLTTKLFALFVVLAFSFSTVMAQDAEADTTAIDPDASPAALYNDGLALLKSKKFAEGFDFMALALEKATAEEDEKVIELASKNGAVAAYSAGNAALKAKDYESAMTYYQSGMDMNPEYPSNYIGKGKVMNAKGDKVGAVEAFIEGGKVAREVGDERKVTEVQKRSKQAVGKLFAAKQYADAITAGKKVEEFEEMPEVMYYVARCQVEEKDFEGALETAEKSIKSGEALGKIEDKFYVAKGLALEGLGKTADAIAAYKMVKEGDYKKQAEYKITELGGK
jgi:tetratricopeptide (TPR) repeat protein